MILAASVNGFSDVAGYLREQERLQRQSFDELISLGGKQSAFDELAAVWEDCRHPNWDGYEALPVSPEALRNAYILIESLPLGISAPSIGAEPDGSFTLEWYQHPHRILSLSVGMDGDIHYAALLGPNRVYGTEVFYGDLPDMILNLIRRVSA